MAKTTDEIRLQERFGERLRSIRVARGISDAKTMAKLLGIKEQAYRKYERGESIPGTLVGLRDICDTLGCPADFLLLGSGPPERESAHPRKSK